MKKRRFEELQSEVSRQGGLDEAQVEQMQGALNRLTEVVSAHGGPARPPWGMLPMVFLSIRQPWRLIARVWKSKDRSLSNASREIDQQAAELKQRWEDLASIPEPAGGEKKKT